MKRLLFMVSTVFLTVLFLVALWMDTNREWTKYQRQFFKTLEPAERRGMQGGIKQILATDLGRVDRCTSCHLTIDKPALALGEEPFTAHPGKFLEWHPIDKFGCTVCHAGQGLATEKAAAHGDVAHWEEPLLRGSFVQASCGSCHGDQQAIAEHVPLLVLGKQLFKTFGCYGCHVVKDHGGTISQDLTEVGSKPYALIEADFENMAHPRDRIHWLMTKLKNPRSLNPGVRSEELPPGEEEVLPTAMPNFGLNEKQVEALTIYLLSLTDADYPASYVTSTPTESQSVLDSTLERGRQVFEKNGCAGCHGVGGVGGRRNWNSGLGEEIPPLLYVKTYYEHDIESLKELIRHGRQPVPRASAARPAPPLYMPSWKDKIPEQEMDDLITYLFSLSQWFPESQPNRPSSEGESPSVGAVPQ